MNAPMPTGHGCHRVTLAAVPWSVEQSTESDNNHSFRAAARRDLVLGPPANVVSLWLQHDSRGRTMLDAATHCYAINLR